jgi:hypothetical protein
MSLRSSDGLTRFGLLALPLAGLLALIGLYSTLQLGSGGILASGDNRAIVSGGYFLSVFLGNILALAVLILGVVALYAYLANGGQSALALGAMVSSVFGIALTLSTVGVNAYAVPALSRSFLEGKTQSIRIIDYVFAGPLGTVSTLAFLLYSAGFVLFGVAVWRSGALPGWAGVLVAVHAHSYPGRLRLWVRWWAHCWRSRVAGGLPRALCGVLPTKLLPELPRALGERTSENSSSTHLGE